MAIPIQYLLRIRNGQIRFARIEDAGRMERELPLPIAEAVFHVEPHHVAAMVEYQRRPRLVAIRGASRRRNPRREMDPPLPTEIADELWRGLPTAVKRELLPFADGETILRLFVDVEGDAALMPWELIGIDEMGGTRPVRQGNWEIVRLRANDTVSTLGAAQRSLRTLVIVGSQAREPHEATSMHDVGDVVRSIEAHSSTRVIAACATIPELGDLRRVHEQDRIRGLDQLLAMIEDGQGYDIVHFIGHSATWCVSDGHGVDRLEIAVEGSRIALELPVARLRSALATCGARVFVAQACESRELVAGALLDPPRRGVGTGAFPSAPDHVITFAAQLPSLFCGRWSRGFYAALAERSTVGEAVRRARRAVGRDTPSGFKEHPLAWIPLHFSRSRHHVALVDEGLAILRRYLLHLRETRILALRAIGTGTVRDLPRLRVASDRSLRSLPELLKHGRHWQLRGPAGSGKSLALLSVAAELAGAESAIPIHVDVRSWASRPDAASGHPSTLFLAGMSPCGFDSAESESLAREFERRGKRGELVFLLDIHRGLDPAAWNAVDQLVTNLLSDAHEWRRCSVVVALRDDGSAGYGPIGQLARADVEPLDDSDRLLLFQAMAPRAGSWLAARAKHRSRHPIWSAILSVIEGVAAIVKCNRKSKPRGARRRFRLADGPTRTDGSPQTRRARHASGTNIRLVPRPRWIDPRRCRFPTAAEVVESLCAVAIKRAGLASSDPQSVMQALRQLAERRAASVQRESRPSAAADRSSILDSLCGDLHLLARDDTGSPTFRTEAVSGWFASAHDHDDSADGVDSDELAELLAAELHGADPRAARAWADRLLHATAIDSAREFGRLVRALATRTGGAMPSPRLLAEMVHRIRSADRVPRASSCAGIEGTFRAISLREWRRVAELCVPASVRADLDAFESRLRESDAERRDLMLDPCVLAAFRPEASDLLSRIGAGDELRQRLCPSASDRTPGAVALREALIRRSNFVMNGAPLPSADELSASPRSQESARWLATGLDPKHLREWVGSLLSDRAGSGEWLDAILSEARAVDLGTVRSWFETLRGPQLDLRRRRSFAIHRHLALNASIYGADRVAQLITGRARDQVRPFDRVELLFCDQTLAAILGPGDPKRRALFASFVAGAKQRAIRELASEVLTTGRPVSGAMMSLFDPALRRPPEAPARANWFEAESLARWLTCEFGVPIRPIGEGRGTAGTWLAPDPEDTTDRIGLWAWQRRLGDRLAMQSCFTLHEHDRSRATGLEAGLLSSKSGA